LEKTQNRYNLEQLSKTHPALSSYIIDGKSGTTIDFGNADAVKALNTALLISDYGLTSYDLPDGYLVPGVTGRRKYIDQVATLLMSKDRKKHNLKKRVIADIGVGANCIYPIIGHKAYGWKFVGVDNNQEAVNTALGIITANDLSESIGLRFQSDENQIIEGWITEDDYFDSMVCNPPFYDSNLEADQHIQRKSSGLKLSKVSRSFAGKPHELIAEGGELGFVSRYIEESKQFGAQVYSYTCLISSAVNLPTLENLLKELECTERRVLITSTSNKASRVLVWSFLTPKQREAWREYRWN